MGVRIPIKTLTDKELGRLRERVIEKYGDPSDQLAAIDREFERRKPDPVLEQIEIVMNNSDELGHW